jgi:choline kinase
MEIIVPAAGLSTRFPNMRPKYTLAGYDGRTMLYNSLKPYIGKYRIVVGVLKEHIEKYNVVKLINSDIGSSNIDIVSLPAPTKGPADTVNAIIKLGDVNLNSSILIKDCDSFFDHEITDGNYVCTSIISDHQVLRKLGNKSFVVSNDQDIIINIIEKDIVSDKFCVGGYKFESAKLFCDSFKYIKDGTTELFVSHVIHYALTDNNIFINKKVSNYTDVGTIEEWTSFNNRPVIFCDIDGTIVKAVPALLDSVPTVPLPHNIKKLIDMQNKGSQLIFTTARKQSKYEQTFNMLEDLGFKNFQLICGLQNSPRILINDYNNANPFPRATAINLKRDSDNLEDYL